MSADFFRAAADMCGQTDSGILPTPQPPNAGLSLLIDHARRDVRDVGAHRADGPVDESLLAVAYVGKHVAGVES